jgi:hypothetical protein
LAVKKDKKKSKTVRKRVKPAKKVKRKHVSGGLVLPRRLGVESKSATIVYGMKIDSDVITRSAVEAFNKRRYTVHDIRLTEYIPDPKFRNLMVKIAVLDRIQEELTRLYPEANVLRPNTVTLMVR